MADNKGSRKNRGSSDGGFEHARGHGAEALDEDFWLDAHEGS